MEICRGPVHVPDHIIEHCDQHGLPPVGLTRVHLRHFHEDRPIPLSHAVVGLDQEADLPAGVVVSFDIFIGDLDQTHPVAVGRQNVEDPIREVFVIDVALVVGAVS